MRSNEHNNTGTRNRFASRVFSRFSHQGERHEKSGDRRSLRTTLFTEGRNEGSTLAERHPDWPQLHIKLFLSPHVTANDMEGMRDHVKNAQVFFYEDTYADKNIRDLLQSASDMSPESDIEAFIASCGVQLEGGKSISGSPLDGYIRGVYGTGVVVEQLDIRQGDKITDSKLEKARNRRHNYNRFSKTLSKLERKERKFAGLQVQRNDIIVNQHLEDLLTEIFERYPGLKELRDLFIVRAGGSIHEYSLTQALRGQGISPEVIFSEEQHYSPNEDIRRKLMAGEHPSRIDLARVQLDYLINLLLKGSIQGTVIRHNQESYYRKLVALQFSFEEIQIIHDIFTGSESTEQLVHDFNGILMQKNISPLPTNDIELDNAITVLEQQQVS